MAISHLLPDGAPGDAGTVRMPSSIVRGQPGSPRWCLGPRAVLPLVDGLALGAAIALSRTAGALSAGYAVAVLSVLAAGRQHRLKITPRVSDQAGRIAVAAALPALGIVPWVTAAGVIRLAVVSAVAVGYGRAVTYQVLRTARRRGRLAEAAVIVGTGETAAELAGLMASHAELGLQPSGFVADQPAGPGGLLPVLGRPADLPEVVRRHHIQRVIVASAVEGDAGLLAALRSARGLPADICVVPGLQELGSAVPRCVLDEVWGIPLIPLRRMSVSGRLLKRVFDVSVSLMLLIVLGPVIAVFAAVTRVQLRRPALFRQIRVTGSGRQAEIVKLRTLNSHGNPDTCWAVPLQQCTAFGRFLRTTHLDELPQLANVLLGRMSLVGPRPERPYFAQRFALEIPDYAGRLRMTAGLTGWAQVHGLSGDTSIRERARFDNAYIENWSLWLDLVIIARTVAGFLACAVAHRVGDVPGAAVTAAEPLVIPPPSGPLHSRETVNESPPYHHRAQCGRRGAAAALDPPAQPARHRRDHALQPGTCRGDDPCGRHDGPRSRDDAQH